MVRSALPSIPLEEIDLLVIENVGNLVCPAEFRVGEDARVMVASVTEGEDKPLKYPLMFRACELVVLNKIDLLPYVDFDVEKWARAAGDRASGRGDAAGERPHRRGRGRVPRLARRAARAPHGGGVTQERTRANSEFFAAESARLAALCDEMAQRFLRGGRLLAVGEESDARHVAVEFVHPVIVGKRALPALALPTLEALELEARAGRHRRRLQRARRCGSRDESFIPPTDDPFVRQELVETLYHVLWELVHVFLEHRDRSPVGRGRGALPVSVPGRRGAADLDAVREDVRRSIEAKAAEIGALREQTLARERGGAARRRGVAGPAACSRWATAARRPTRWTSSPTCGRAGGARWT